jgi:peptidoglycan glycosyltransferase
MDNCLNLPTFHLPTNMQTNIHRSLNLMLALFFLVALWLGYWGIARAPELLAREDNPRHVEAERRVQRGWVLDRHGTPLAWSEVDADGYVERCYAGDWLAHVVGYYSLRHGVGGIEATFDEQLRGEAGRRAWEIWRDDLLHRLQIGEDIQLTLDTGLQRAASEALGEQMGAVVLLDVQTGGVLALVSHPTFDPNRLDEEWDALREAPGQPLFNRATQGLYPPGAIFNLVVMAAALEEGLTAPDEVFHDKYGRTEVSGATVRCANHPGLVALDLFHAAAYGCNAAFAQLSLRLGSDRLADYTKQFGVDHTPELEIPTEAGQLARVLPLSPETLALTGSGQGDMLVSPLQMALVVATVANDGQMPRPTLLLNQTESVQPVVSPETARLVRQAMTLAVTEGPADQAALPGITVAGKVGTAEAGDKRVPHAWFVGFAPAGPSEMPGFSIAVVVEHGGSGNRAAAPIAAQLLAMALDAP